MYLGLLGLHAASSKPTCTGETRVLLRVARTCTRAYLRTYVRTYAGVKEPETRLFTDAIPTRRRENPRNKKSNERRAEGRRLRARRREECEKFDEKTIETDRWGASLRDYFANLPRVTPPRIAPTQRPPNSKSVRSQLPDALFAAAFS